MLKFAMRAMDVEVRKSDLTSDLTTFTMSPGNHVQRQALRVFLVS